MQHNDEGALSVVDLERAMEGLTSLLKKDATLSNAGKILAQIKQLQITYQNLDPHAKNIIDDHLQRNRQDLYEALQKKSGSNKQSTAAKVFAAGTIIHDSLKTELEKITKEHPSIITMKATAIPSYEVSEDEFFMADTGTTRIHEDQNNSGQLKDAIAGADRQLDSKLYQLLAAPDADDLQIKDPLTAVIDALEVLRRTKINKDKIQLQRTPKPKGFDNSYRETLLKQTNILVMNKHVLADITLGGHNHSNLSAIQDKLAATKMTSVPAILKLAGEITELIDESLTNGLRAAQGKQQTDTPRYSK